VSRRQNVKRKSEIGNRKAAAKNGQWTAGNRELKVEREEKEGRGRKMGKREGRGREEGGKRVGRERAGEGRGKKEGEVAYLLHGTLNALPLAQKKSEASKKAVSCPSGVHHFHFFARDVVGLVSRDKEAAVLTKSH
jgi:hypothetical protein